MIVRPRRVGIFLTSRCWTSCIWVAVSRIVRIAGGVEVGHREEVARHTRVRRRHRAPPVIVTLSASSKSASRTRTFSVCGGREVLADVVGADRELAVAAVDEDGEPHRGGTPVVGEGVERGADGAPAVEDVVDEDDGLAVDARVGDLAWASAPGWAGVAGRRGTS